MNIEFNKVTWYSLMTAIVLYLGIYFIGFYVGKQFGVIEAAASIKSIDRGIINSVTFKCADAKSIRAIFFNNKVELMLDDDRNMLLQQAISASGARYANSDESFIFWNKGDTAFMQEAGKTTYKDCMIEK